MNERIKELALQATEYNEQTLTGWLNPEKFAGALLREYIAPLQEELDRAHKIVVHNERDWGVREARITLLTNLIQDAKAKFGLEE